MRPFIFTLLLCVCATVVRAEEETNATDPFAGAPAPLAEAFRRFGRDANRWAYTQRLTQFDRKGQQSKQWAARYDPSQHYDVQWTLLERDGQAPTEKQQEKFRKERAKRSGERRSLGEMLELKKATPVDATEAGLATDPETLVYEVPLKNVSDSRFPPEKFRVFVRVARKGNLLQSIDVKLRDRFRVGLVVNVKAGEARLDFQQVREDAGPALTSISAGGAGSVMFVPVGARVEITRSELKRVTPYDERFNVKIGPLRAIDF